MRLLRLGWTMLRYRVALMLVMFFVLGVVTHDPSLAFRWQFIPAALAIVIAYVAATSVNDIIDYRIDLINHAKSKARPLINGTATKRDLWIVHTAATILSFGLAALAGWEAFLLMIPYHAISYAYSVPPLLLSHRTTLAPLALTAAYVVVPFLMGATLAGPLTSWDGWFVSACAVLFLGRIILKDFRDRRGDARFGKRTFLLRFGKPTTIAVSVTTISIGAIGILALIPATLELRVISALLIPPIILCLIRLRRESKLPEELKEIALAAKLGNGFLICLITMVLLNFADVPLVMASGTVALIVTMYLYNYSVLRRVPGEQLLGYKG